MARKQKKGLDAFPFDTDMFQDIKVRKLIKYQGTKAIAVYTCLLCNIYRNGYYLLWDNELPFALSESLGCDEGFVREVIECCIKIGLFDENFYRTCHVLTSRGIQLRYQQTMQRGRRGAAVSEYTLLDSPHLNDMLASPLWVNQMRRKHNLSKEGFEAALHEWSKQCAAAGLIHKSTGIAKQHFDRWQSGDLELVEPEQEQEWYDDSQLFGEMFGTRTMLMESFCRDNNISLEQCAQYARSILNEWQITQEHHSNLTEARRHMLNAIRQRAAGQTTTRSRGQWHQELQGEAMRLVNKVYTPNT